MAQIEAALEKAGAVPANDNDLHDWQRAQRTSWWGTQLDPKQFWKGRVLWNDGSATSDAQRHGRLYPPMPYEDTNLPPYPNDEGIHGSYSPDGPNIFYANSSKERAFWDRFDKTHPRPPDQIEYEQGILSKKEIVLEDESTPITERERREAIQMLPADAVKDNYPPEAFTKDALFWSRVMSKRAEYQSYLDMGDQTNEPVFKVFFSSLAVDPKYITEPLTREQIQAANAWKIAYLKRLKAQNADQSYLNAYLQAWNLSSKDVFGSGN
jgi:hypothetical protein